MGGTLALWLVPEEPARSRLDAVIAGLAERLGSPAFRAHVTLLGGVGLGENDVLQRAHRLAASLRPVPLSLRRAGQEPEYFRCVYLEAEATADVLGAHQRARRAMGGGPDRFHPHLSLVYGRLEEAVRADLVREAARVLELPLRLTAGRLEVYETRGRVPRWRLCDEFALGG